jgi:hypothetical protein
VARQALEGILAAGKGKSGEPEEIRKAAFKALRRLQRGQARANAQAAQPSA